MATRRKGYMTVDEHHAKLKAEGKWEAYVERRRAGEEARQRQIDSLTRAEAPLVQALRAHGTPLTSVWDLVNAGTKRPARTFRISTDPPDELWDWLEAQGVSYASLLSVLLDHLQCPYPDAIRAGLARALTIPEARSHWSTLVRLYRQEQGPQTREGLAVALSGIATDEVLSDIIALTADRTQGPSRVLLLSALDRSKDSRARDALDDLSADPELEKELGIIRSRWLKRLKRRSKR